MAEPIKHAPGVVCIIRVRERASAPSGPPERVARYAQELAEITGRTVTIIAPARPFTTPDGMQVLVDAYGDRPAWLVQAETPLPLHCLGYRRLLYTPVRALLQVNLIPIAGPGIDVDETTTIETPVPTQSPVPETA